MMKPRLSNRTVGDQTISSRINKQEQSAINNQSIINNIQRNQAQLLNNQQANAQAIRKRRSSINVYDQPSSLNSRLRQLETDMLRLDEDRTKLFDDTHSALAQSELKLNEIHAILKSRQDNVEKYVEDMKLLLQAKEEFEKQTKLLNEKHDRIQEKFMHRETTISREIKLLKNKFELLEKNRQFRSILQKSNINNNNNNLNFSDLNDELSIDGNKISEQNSTGEIGNNNLNSTQAESSSSEKSSLKASTQQRGPTLSNARKNVRIKLSKFGSLKQLFSDLIDPLKNKFMSSKRRTNRVSSISINSNQSLSPQTSPLPQIPTTTLTSSVSPTLTTKIINNDNNNNNDNNDPIVVNSKDEKS